MSGESAVAAGRGHKREGAAGANKPVFHFGTCTHTRTAIGRCCYGGAVTITIASQIAAPSSSAGLEKCAGTDMSKFLGKPSPGSHYRGGDLGQSHYRLRAGYAPSS